MAKKAGRMIRNEPDILGIPQSVAWVMVIDEVLDHLERV